MFFKKKIKAEDLGREAFVIASTWSDVSFNKLSDYSITPSKDETSRFHTFWMLSVYQLLPTIFGASNPLPPTKQYSNAERIKVGYLDKVNQQLSHQSIRGGLKAGLNRTEDIHIQRMYLLDLGQLSDYSEFIMVYILKSAFYRNKQVKEFRDELACKLLLDHGGAIREISHVLKKYKIL